MPSSGIFAIIGEVVKKMSIIADDIAVAAKPLSKASGKLGAIVVDDGAVTAKGLGGVAQERELAMIGKLATISFFGNKLLLGAGFIALNAFAPAVTPIILLAGGAYLAYESAAEVKEKLPHAAKWLGHKVGFIKDKPVASNYKNEEQEPGWFERQLGKMDASKKPWVRKVAAWFGTGHERRVISDLTTKDTILSAEIIVISMKYMLAGGAAISLGVLSANLLAIGVIATALVYGVVAGVVRTDNMAAALARTEGQSWFAKAKRGLGYGITQAFPYAMTGIGMLGIAAMGWIGGAIVLGGLGLTALPFAGTLLGQLAYGLAAGGAIIASKSAIGFVANKTGLSKIFAKKPAAKKNTDVAITAAKPDALQPMLGAKAEPVAAAAEPAASPAESAGVAAAEPAAGVNVAAEPAASPAESAGVVAAESAASPAESAVETSGVGTKRPVPPVNAASAPPKAAP